MPWSTQDSIHGEIFRGRWGLFSLKLKAGTKIFDNALSYSEEKEGDKE